MTLPLDIPQEALALIVQGRALTWLNAYDWLINLEWDSKHKINLPRNTAAALKPQGELLVSYLRLCERCHTLQGITRLITEEANPYPSAAHWFAEIYRELIHVTIIEDISDKDKYWEGKSKRNFIEIERRKIAALKRKEGPFATNPYCPDLPKFAQELCRLFACCFILSDIDNSGDRFSQNYWHPFLKKYGQWIQEMTKPSWRTMRVKDGKIYIQGYKKGNQPDICLGELKNHFLLSDKKHIRSISIEGQYNLSVSNSVKTIQEESIKENKNIKLKNRYFETLTLQGL
ncbi:hypothetical protein H6G96_32545 [Nostoc sp. FACHB-892]|uniref:hypothetical protein n=1 Tax=Nostoc sp. FACHB-892 TaxID=2692843 RepID=UPI001683351A|nr:hypothetical protein [Nostoc sp. FACHB-892]MBD2730922.1 hypothetical protein [Nostoc sp. FACHB-892]